ncbi:MAG: hypothetical protein RLZZ244_1143 [Verrucomicrobiota bacterium]
MGDLCRGVGAQGEPVSNAIGNDECALVFPVESGPVAEHGGAHAETFIEHELSAVGVSGEGEGNPLRLVERVGVMREQQGERPRILAFLEEGFHAASPGKPQQFDGGCPEVEAQGFIDEEWNGRRRFFAETARIREEVVIALHGNDPMARAKSLEQFEARRKVVQRVVHEIPGKQHQIRVECVGGVDDLLEDTAVRETAHVRVAHMGDGESVEAWGKRRQRNLEPPDSEVVERGESARGGSEGDEGGTCGERCSEEGAAGQRAERLGSGGGSGKWGGGTEEFSGFPEQCGEDPEENQGREHHEVPDIDQGE